MEWVMWVIPVVLLLLGFPLFMVLLGTATVLLPSRGHGPVRLPDPPGGARDLETALAAISDAFSRR